MRIELPFPLLACRHGHSIGNALRAEAEQSGRLEIASIEPDHAFALTSHGYRQAQTLGRRIAALPATESPVDIVCSPYRRAQQTALVILDAMHHPVIPLRVDSRLRPKAFGVLERLTRRGEAQAFPHLVAQRASVGRFHFCPPGGESRCDVVLRVREFLLDWCHWAQGPLLLVTHQVVINALDYLLSPDPATAMATNSDGRIPNAQLYRYDTPERLPIPAYSTGMVNASTHVRVTAAS